MEEPEPRWYCVDCGVALRPEHEYCWNCGARRWHPSPPAEAVPPRAGAKASVPRAPSAVPGLGVVRFFLAFWGVLLVVWATYQLALVLYFASSLSTPEVAVNSVAIGLAVALALLHALAYHGVTALHQGGWVVAVVVTGLWSLVVIGMPALYILLQRPTREAFGLA